MQRRWNKPQGSGDPDCVPLQRLEMYVISLNLMGRSFRPVRADLAWPSAISEAQHRPLLESLIGTSSHHILANPELSCWQSPEWGDARLTMF